MRPILAIAAGILVIALAGCSNAAPPAGANAPAVTSPGPIEVAATPTAETATTTAFDDIVLKGKGKKVAKIAIPEDAAAIAVLTHKGESNFIVDSIGADGETLDGLVNEIGNYSGTVLFDAAADEHTVAFKIDADGAWTITVKSISGAPVWNPATTLKGKGDSVYRVSPASAGLVTLDLTFKGDANFIVDAYAADGSEGLANEIGKFTGQVLLPDGTFLLVVEANGGAWTVTPG
jgi:hypothetical protein